MKNRWSSKVLKVCLIAFYALLIVNCHFSFKGHSKKRRRASNLTSDLLAVPGKSGDLEESTGAIGPEPAGDEVLLDEEFGSSALERWMVASPEAPESPLPTGGRIMAVQDGDGDGGLLVLEDGSVVRSRSALPARTSLTVDLRLNPPREGAVEVQFVTAATENDASGDPAVRVRVTGDPEPRLEMRVGDRWVAVPGGIVRHPGGRVHSTFVLHAEGRLEVAPVPGLPFSLPLSGALPFPLSVQFLGNPGATLGGIRVSSP